MMNEELKRIKKIYGEKMMHLCREKFPSILEISGLLLETLQNNFYPSRKIYDDLVSTEKINEFVDFIYLKTKKEEEIEIIECKSTPKELLAKAGYDLYQCNTEQEIQHFKRYYKKGEQLCTFNGGRLERCYVFFAVKKDVAAIRRQDFNKPERQDRYGTSVISIQFTKDDSHILSIKNRYNHTVLHPDATFSNNLDNIIEGLTKSFEHEYGLRQKHKNKFEIPGYVLASDGKYYKYNYEINNIYFCPNNIVIKNFKPYQYDKSKYIIIDTLLIDLENKKISNLVSLYEDVGSLDKLKNINKISITKYNEYKIINIDDKIIIEIDSSNKIIKYIDNVTEFVGNCFFYHNTSLEYICMPNVRRIGTSFLYRNTCLKIISLDKVETIEKNFLYCNHDLTSLNLPNLISIKDSFLFYNSKIKEIHLPKLMNIGDCFLNKNNAVKFLYLPSVEKIGMFFMENNNSIVLAKLPKLKEFNYSFLKGCQGIKEIYMPNLKKFGKEYLKSASNLQVLGIPDKIVNSFVYSNSTLRQCLKGNGFFKKNKKKSEKQLVLIRNNKI